MKSINGGIYRIGECDDTHDETKHEDQKRVSCKIKRRMLYRREILHLAPGKSASLEPQTKMHVGQPLQEGLGSSCVPPPPSANSSAIPKLLKD